MFEKKKGRAFKIRPEECPVDCDFSEWSAWTPCEPYCEGAQRLVWRWILGGGWLVWRVGLYLGLVCAVSRVCKIGL